MTYLPRIAGRLFNAPLLVLPETALTVAANLSDRLGVDMDGVEVPAGRHRVAFSFRPLSMDNLVAAAVDLVDNDGQETVPTRTQ